MTPFAQQLRLIRRISLCQVADALGSAVNLETEITPIDPHFRICGPALTVACAPDDNLTLHHALHVAHAGQVLVVSGGKNGKAALWGELMSLAARQKGLGGTTLDGPARDYWEVKALGYPLFARGLTPRKASKEKYGEINVPIQCGRLWVNPGDVILADRNGILSIPPDQLERTIKLATVVMKQEIEIKKQIAKSRTIFEILGLENRMPKRT